jgi:hypothetical protein
MAVEDLLDNEMDYSDALNKIEELYMKLDLNDGKCENWFEFRAEVAAALVTLDKGVELVWRYEELSR